MNKEKKIGPIIIHTIIIFVFFFGLTEISFGDIDTYIPLEPLPGIGGGTTPTDINSYIATLFNLGIIVATLSAVFMIARGGFQYMLSDVVGKKAEGKKIIWNAIWGLLLALVSWLILQIINPQINIPKDINPRPVMITKPTNTNPTKTSGNANMIDPTNKTVIYSYQDMASCTAAQSQFRSQGKIYGCQFIK